MTRGQQPPRMVAWKRCASLNGRRTLSQQASGAGWQGHCRLLTGLELYPQTVARPPASPRPCLLGRAPQGLGNYEKGVCHPVHPAPPSLPPQAVRTFPGLDGEARNPWPSGRKKRGPRGGTPSRREAQGARREFSFPEIPKGLCGLDARLLCPGTTCADEAVWGQGRGHQLQRASSTPACTPHTIQHPRPSSQHDCRSQGLALEALHWTPYTRDFKSSRPPCGPVLLRQQHRHTDRRADRGSGRKRPRLGSWQRRA